MQQRKLAVRNLLLVKSPGPENAMWQETRYKLAWPY